MKEFIFKDRYGKELCGYKWGNENLNEIKGIIQLVHGMAEWCGRYDYVAKRFVEEGYIVLSYDQRGHGKSADDLGYVSDEHSFKVMVENIKDFNDFIRDKYPNKEIILLGHSMGSFLSQRYAQEHGDTIDKLILSGSNGKPENITKVGRGLAKVEMDLKGRKFKSKLMDKISFGNFNDNFKPVRTNADWICSVDEEVDKYLNDPYCGFICSISFYHDLIDGIWSIHDEDNREKINKETPIYIFSGDKDPVGNFGEGVKNLYNGYLTDGVKNVKYKLYKDGRHEMFNEKNRDEVINDVLNWIENN